MPSDNYIPLSEEKNKAPRIRSVAYPSLTIGDCQELTSKIYKIFGDSMYTSREEIAKKLHISESHLQTQVSSCVQYGLLELKAKEGYRPTELYIKLYKPLPDENISDAYIILFTNPELYKTLVEQFNGKQLPQEDGLASILYRKYKVSEKASPLAAKIFIQSAFECGFLKEDNILNVQGKISVTEDAILIDENKNEQRKDQVLYLTPRSETKAEVIEKSEIPPIPIFLDNGEVAKLYMPKGFTKDDLKRVAKVLNGYID